MDWMDNNPPEKDSARGGEGEKMKDYEIRETLEKQLQLLSERSQMAKSAADLEKLTTAMCDVIQLLLNP